MDCPDCHFKLNGNEYFCPNCGKKLKDKTLSTTLTKQLQVYVLSFFLAPLGFWWTYKYLKQTDKTSKIVGLACFIITTMALVIGYKLIVDSLATITNQINGLNSFKVPVL